MARGRPVWPAAVWRQRHFYAPAADGQSARPGWLFPSGFLVLAALLVAAGGSRGPQASRSDGAAALDASGATWTIEAEGATLTTMNSESAPDYSGTWSIPDVYAGPVYGKLSGDDRFKLVLHGLPLEDRQKTILLYHLNSTIHGDCSGLNITLLGSRAISYHPNGTVQIEFWSALIGVHVSRGDAFTFKTASIHIDGTTDWAGRRPLEPGVHSDGGSTFDIKYASPETLRARVDGAELCLSSSVRSSMGITTASIEHTDYFVVKLQSTCNIDLLMNEYVRPLQYLLALASETLPKVSRLVVVVEGEGYTQSVDVWLRAIRLNEPPPVRPSDELAFTLADFDFAKMLPRWFAVVRRYRSACDLLFGQPQGQYR